MKKILATAIIIIGLFLLPLSVHAVGAGFVPNTGVWFSPTEFLPNQNVKIYTVVINNDFYGLDGAVQFFDGDSLIDSVEIKNLPRENAKEIKVYWQPAEGKHTISAKFTKPMSIDENGKKTAIDLNQINAVAGAPLILSGNVAPNLDAQMVVAPSPLTFEPGATSGEQKVNVQSTQTVGQMRVEVKKTGNKLLLIAGDKIYAATGTVDQTFSSSTSTSTDDLFAKNHDILSSAGNTLNTLTSTVDKISSAYAKTTAAIEQTKAAIEKGKTYYKQAKNFLTPIWETLQPGWLAISDNNDPKRILIIVGVVLLVYFILRRALRRRHHYYDNF